MSALHERLERQLDAIDAAVFTGDGVCSPEAIERFRFFLRRWEKALAEREEPDAEAVHARSCCCTQHVDDTTGRARMSRSGCPVHDETVQS